MAKSDCGLPAKSGATKQSISEEERILRWEYGLGELPDMTLKQFNIKVKEIRKRKKKP